MASSTFVLPYNPAFSSNGLPVPGAKLNFYLAGTLTRATVYQDVGLTVPHTNPVEANSAGRFADIYWDDAINIRVILTDADDVTLDESDPYLYGGADFTASDILTKLLTVDGAGSLIDADLLDGSQGSAYAKLAGGTAFTGAVSTTSNLTVDGNATLGNAAGDSVTVAGTLRLTNTADVTLASTDHAFQIGASGAANIAADDNEIQARNNGSTATLSLNLEGGNVSLCAGAFTATATGTVIKDTNSTGTSIDGSIAIQGSDSVAVASIGRASGSATLVYENSSLHQFAIAGAVQVTIGVTAVNFNTGNALQISGTQVLSARKTGWTAATGTASRATFATASVTTEQLAQRVKALLDDLISHGVIGA